MPPFNIIQQPSNSVQQNRMDVEAMTRITLKFLTHVWVPFFYISKIGGVMSWGRHDRFPRTQVASFCCVHLMRTRKAIKLKLYV